MGARAVTKMHLKAGSSSHTCKNKKVHRIWHTLTTILLKRIYFFCICWLPLQVPIPQELYYTPSQTHLDDATHFISEVTNCILHHDSSGKFQAWGKVRFWSNNVLNMRFCYYNDCKAQLM